jgi:general secretion pathway protein N
MNMKLNLQRRYIVIALVVYFLALLATIPASLFTGVINRNLPGVTVTDLQGSLWSGRIGHLYVAGNSLEGVEWHLQPWALLLGRLQLGLEYADQRNHVELSLARGFTGSNQIRGLEGQLQVEWVQGLTPYSIPVFKGMLQFDDVYLSLDGIIPVDASGTLHWRGAAVDMGQTVRLGQLQARLDRSEDKVLVVLNETSGRLEGDARLSIAEDGGYRLEAKLKPTDKGADLTRHLALVMQRSSDGSFRYNRQGHLPAR